MQNNTKQNVNNAIKKEENKASARSVVKEVLSGTSSFGLRSLMVALHYAGNSYIMSTLGRSASAAASIAIPGTALMMGAMSGLTAATGVELGKALGKKNDTAVSAVIRTGWLMTLGLGALASLGFISIGKMMPLFLEENVATAASSYFAGYAIAAIPELWVWSNGQIPFKVEEKTTKGIAALPIATAGLYRIPALAVSYYFAQMLKFGSFGVGLGAAVSGIINVLAFQPWYSKEIYKKYNLYNLRIKNFKTYVLQYLKTGWPVSLQRVSEWLNLFLITQVSGARSSKELLAEQPSIALSVASGFMSQGSGQYSMIQVTQDRTGMKRELQNYYRTGEQKYLNKVASLQTKNKKHFIVSNVAGVIFNLALASAVYFGRQKIIDFYSAGKADSETSDLATLLIMISAASLPIDGVRNITAGVLRGWNDMIFPTLMSLLFMTMIAIPVGAGVGETQSQSATSLFLSRLIALLLSTGVNLFRYAKHTSEDTRMYQSALSVKDILTQLVEYTNAQPSEELDIANSKLTLQRKAESFGLTFNAPTDGNSIFHATADALSDKKENNKDYVEVRRLIVEHIKNYKEQYTEVLNGHISADDVMLNILSRALGVNIVLIEEEGPAIISKQRAAEKTIFLGKVVDRCYVCLAGVPNESLAAQIEQAQFDSFADNEITDVQNGDIEQGIKNEDSTLLQKNRNLPKKEVSFWGRLFGKPAVRDGAKNYTPALNYGSI